MVGPFLSYIINTVGGRSRPRKSERNTAHPEIGLHPNPRHVRAIFFLLEALADPSGHGRGRSWGRCGRRSTTSVGRGGTSRCSRRRGACWAPRPATPTVGPSRACSTATAPRWQGPGARPATGRPRCGRSCGPTARIPSSRPRSVWRSPSSPSSSSSASHTTASATPSGPSSLSSAASCLLSSLFLLTYLWFDRCSTNWKVFVASDRFLLHTLIQTAATAMASTLKRSYLSIYSWFVLFRRVQVLYYALLRKGHLDVYVASREAAPPRTENHVALPLISYLQLADLFC